MNTIDAIKQRSSTRKFTRDPLNESETAALVEAGLRAPTATNRRELHFSVLKAGNAILSEINAETERLYGVKSETNFYYDAPLVIFIGAECGFSWSPVDAGIAVENIALAAEDLGLGSVILGCVYDALRGEKSGYFEKLLGFPKGYAYEIAIAVGRKAAQKEPHTYNADEQVTFIDR